MGVSEWVLGCVFAFTCYAFRVQEISLIGSALNFFWKFIVTGQRLFLHCQDIHSTSYFLLRVSQWTLQYSSQMTRKDARNDVGRRYGDGTAAASLIRNYAYAFPCSPTFPVTITRVASIRFLLLEVTSSQKTRSRAQPLLNSCSFAVRPTSRPF